MTLSVLINMHTVTVQSVGSEQSGVCVLTHDYLMKHVV